MLQTKLPEALRQANLQVAVCPAQALPTAYVDQLIQKSLQPHIKRFCPKDATERFKDQQTYQAWAGDGSDRVLYLLVHPNNPDDIAGIIWFAKKQHPDAPGYSVTFALRLYDEDQQKGWGKYLGKGLAGPFMAAAHADVAKYFPGERLWLSFDTENQAAQRTYEKFGYRTLAQTADRVIMGYDKDNHE